MIRCQSVNNVKFNLLPEIISTKRSNSAITSKAYLNNNKTDQNVSNTSSDILQISEDHRCPRNEKLKSVEIIPNVYISLIITNQTKILLGIPIIYSINDLCERVSQYFDVPTYEFELVFDDSLHIINNESTFLDLNLKPNSITEAIVQLHDMDILINLHMIRIIKNDANLPMKNTLFIHSRNLETNAVYTTRVDIERIAYTKYFLGGFKHKQTGIEYHHAVTQTRPIAKSMPALDMFSRDTQTHKIANRTIDNVVTTCTQMTKTAYYVSNVTDRVVTPHNYQTADELQAFIVEKVIVIQKNFRRWLAKKRVEKLREIRKFIMDYELGEKTRKSNELLKRLQVLFDKRRCPLYNDDFDLLYHAIEKWRLKEISKIPADVSESVRKAILCRIMDEQHNWLTAVDRLKNNANKILNFRAKKNKLVKVSKPIVWKDNFGELIQMDLMNTTRGKEVYEIYKSLSMDFFNQEERLDILLTLKRLIANRPEKICTEMTLLINREGDLIMRNVAMIHLKGLRTRINTLFLILCRLPSFNPGVEKFLKVPANPLDLRGTFQLCRYCNKYLKNSQFMFSVKSKKLGPCRNCTRLFNHAMPRHELSPYRNALYLLQKAEEEYQDNSKMAFIFSEVDMRHLITKIWDSKSILSSNEDLEQLIFIRWSKTTEWSPWNTALMTVDEAEAHYKIDEPCSAYNEKLLDKIHQKQILGHNYFIQLNDLSDNLTVHNLEEEKAKIEKAKLEDKEKFIQEKSVRFL